MHINTCFMNRNIERTKKEEENLIQTKICGEWKTRKSYKCTLGYKYKPKTQTPTHTPYLFLKSLHILYQKKRRSIPTGFKTFV